MTAFLFSEEITGDETENYASQMSLPGYGGEKREYDETTDNG